MVFSATLLRKGLLWLKREVLLATHNPGKVREFQQLLRDAPFSLSVLKGSGEVAAETGSTYLDNARIKAHTVSQATGRPTLADDSGVEVDALGGLPGIHSARFVSDIPWENSREILTRLIAVPRARRTARMRAVLCIAWPDGRDVWAEGVLEGMILGWPKGHRGFGVDPIFSVDGQRALAEMSADDKNQISHRALAAQKLLAKLALTELWGQ